MARSISLQSPHDPAAIARMLKAAVIDRPSEDSPTQIAGRATEARVTLWVHHQHVINNFRTLFTATLTAQAGGTRIDGRMGMARPVRWIMGCWLLVAGLFAVGGLVPVVTGIPMIFAAPFALIPFGMFAFGFVLWWLGRRGATADGAAILAFLAKTIDARSITGQFPAQPNRPLGR